MEVKGRIVFNLGIQQGTSKSGKPWSKASIIIETEGSYPKKILLDNFKNADEFSKLMPGVSGTFHIEISSNEFNGRWYTSVSCWKWELASQGQAPAYPAPQPSATPTLDAMGVQGYQNRQTPPLPPAGDDDLPF